ncbi:MAG TPA: hypothetical protein VFZ49_09460 [Pyrinomonadaceae bacterium]
MIYSDQSLARRLERTEARANADFVETRAKMEPDFGAEWIDVGGAYAMFDGVGSPLTQTFGLGMFEEVEPRHLDEIETFYRDRGSEVFHEISPMADQSILKLLGERGYRPVELTNVMYLELDTGREIPDPLNPAIIARRINEDEADLWAETAAAGWETEFEGMGEFMLGIGKISARTKGSQAFIAELERRAIAAGGFGIYDDICILAGAATIPDARKQGAQNALLGARLNYAVEQGCSLAMMGALPGSQSQKNAQKNGFNIAYTRIKWQLIDPSE